MGDRVHQGPSSIILYKRHYIKERVVCQVKSQKNFQVDKNSFL